MKALWRIIVAVSAIVMAGAPALAQETAAPAQNELVGPPQLRNFSLNGTVTRQAQEPAAERPAAPQPQPSTQQASERPRQPRPDQASEPTREPAIASTRSQPQRRTESTADSGREERLDLPAPTRARRTSTPPLLATDEPVDSSPATFVPAATDAALDPAQGGIAILPWLLAALALIGGAAWYFLRQRPRESYAGASALAFQGPSPASAPVRAPPPPPAAAPKPAPSGIVSTRLRPWLDIEFKPLRAVVDDGKAAVQFELVVVNTGSAPARGVLVEACLFNAGPMQDSQIRAFFENPVAQGDRIPVIAPMQRVSLNTAVLLPRDQVRPIEMEGRQLFVPLVGFNALYSWSGGEGQTSTSYLVGKETSGEKLAPFRVDLGPRMFRNLAAREHELRLRK